MDSDDGDNNVLKMKIDSDNENKDDNDKDNNGNKINKQQSHSLFFLHTFPLYLSLLFFPSSFLW